MTTDKVRLVGKTNACSFCLVEDIESYEKDYLNKNRTADEIVQAIKNDVGIRCSRAGFYNHMRYHVRREMLVYASKNAPELANELVDKTLELIEFLDNLKDKIEKIEKEIHAGSDPTMIKAYVSMMSESRKMIETLAKIQGDLKGSERINVKNMTIQYTAIASQILQDTCPVCREKLTKTLEPIILKDARNKA